MTDLVKAYIGDSVYASYDGYNFILTTENGLMEDPSNTIFLERNVLEKLIMFAQLSDSERHERYSNE